MRFVHSGAWFVVSTAQNASPEVFVETNRGWDTSDSLSNDAVTEERGIVGCRIGLVSRHELTNCF